MALSLRDVKNLALKPEELLSAGKSKAVNDALGAGGLRNIITRLCISARRRGDELSWLQHRRVMATAERGIDGSGVSALRFVQNQADAVLDRTGIDTQAEIDLGIAVISFALLQSRLKDHSTM